MQDDNPSGLLGFVPLPPMPSASWMPGVGGGEPAAAHARREEKRPPGTPAHPEVSERESLR